MISLIDYITESYVINESFKNSKILTSVATQCKKYGIPFNEVFRTTKNRTWGHRNIDFTQITDNDFEAIEVTSSNAEDIYANYLYENAISDNYKGYLLLFKDTKSDLWIAAKIPDVIGYESGAVCFVSLVPSDIAAKNGFSTNSNIGDILTDWKTYTRNGAQRTTSKKLSKKQTLGFIVGTTMYAVPTEKLDTSNKRAKRDKIRDGATALMSDYELRKENLYRYNTSIFNKMQKEGTLDKFNDDIVKFCESVENWIAVNKLKTKSITDNLKKYLSQLQGLAGQTEGAAATPSHLKWSKELVTKINDEMKEISKTMNK